MLTGTFLNENQFSRNTLKRNGTNCYRSKPFLLNIPETYNLMFIRGMVRMGLAALQFKKKEKERRKNENRLKERTESLKFTGRSIPLRSVKSFLLEQKVIDKSTHPPVARAHWIWTSREHVRRRERTAWKTIVHPRIHEVVIWHHHIGHCHFKFFSFWFWPWFMREVTN